MSGTTKWTASALALVAVAGFGLAGLGCGNSGDTGGEGSASGDSPSAKVSGSVTVDGSSTVEPISSVMAEEFMTGHPDVQITVAASGTGGGFKKFANGEIDIAGASRPIKDEEAAACKAGGIEWIELPVGYDGLSVLVNPQNDFVDDISVAELKKIWEPNSKAMMWSDVRPTWPKEKIKLYGPGTDSGTFDYFTKEIVGEEGASRKDYQPSEDDNILVQGIAGDKYSLGYFGFSYYEKNQDKLKLVKVDGIAPSPDTILDGTYKPLSRPLYIYVNKKSLDKPAVAAYVKFYLESGKKLVPAAFYVPLPDEMYTKGLEVLDKKQVGPSGIVSSSK